MLRNKHRLLTPTKQVARDHSSPCAENQNHSVCNIDSNHSWIYNVYYKNIRFKGQYSEILKCFLSA